MTAVAPAFINDYVFFNGYSEQPRMPNASFESDTGLPIERPKGTVKLVDLNISVILTPEQVETWEDFVQTDLEQATGDFYMLHPRRQVQVRVRLRGRPPYSLIKHTPDYWRLSFQVTVIG